MTPLLSEQTFDRVLDALGHQYRRRLLLALQEHNPQSDEDLQEAEAALRAALDADEKPDGARLEMVHRHLPKLDDAGYITWDQVSGEIAKGPDWEEIEPVLTLLDDHEDELPDGWL